MNAITTATSVDPLLRPRTVLDPFNATRREASQRAAMEGRLSPDGTYTALEPLDRMSFITVGSGIAAFVVALFAGWLTIWTYLGRIHQGTLFLDGGPILALILVNVAALLGSGPAHEGLHYVACRLLQGSPTLASEPQNGVFWAAPGQGFSRAGYLTVLLFPFVAFTVIWLIVLAVVPVLAACLIAGLVANTYTSGRDCWLAYMVTRQPESAAIFADTRGGFVAYVITATKVARKKPESRSTTKK